MTTNLLNKSVFRMSVLAISLSGGLLLHAGAQEMKPDNTATNKRDQKASQPTADQGKNNKSDVELAGEIRRKVVKDKNLSTYGHNVKIIVQGGMVTLKGPVHTDSEKNTIAQYAKEIAGDGNVTDNLTVKTKSK